MASVSPQATKQTRIAPPAIMLTGGLGFVGDIAERYGNRSSPTLLTFHTSII